MVAVVETAAAAAAAAVETAVETAVVAAEQEERSFHLYRHMRKQWRDGNIKKKYRVIAALSGSKRTKRTNEKKRKE